ncbi:MAG TPA: septation protein SepH, partial [Blastococcus sp.]
FMTERLRLIDSDIDAVTWDAYRSDDGTWQITGAWRAGDKSGRTRWSFDLPSRTVTPSDAATMDFAEGTRLVRVVPDVPGLAAGPAAHRGRGVSVVREPPRADDDLTHDTVTPDILPADLVAQEDACVRDVHAATGTPDDDRSIDALLDEVAEHDTVVLSRSGDEPEADDPRARIPAWEDIVFGVRRHR